MAEEPASKPPDPSLAKRKPALHAPSAPRVSVLMPVHNAADTVLAACESILDGGFEALELLVIDDGSTDGSGDRVRALAQRRGDARLAVIARPHAGIVAALNHGLSCCRSPLVARMDADDLAHADRLAKQVEQLRRDELDLVGSAVRIVDRQGQAVASMQRYQDWINEHLDHDSIVAHRFIESPFVHPTVLAKREVFELGYHDGDLPEDYDLWLRVIAAGFRVGKCADPLLDWVESPHRLTRVDGRYSVEAFDRCRREHLLAGPLREVHQRGGEVDLCGAGKTGKPWMRWLQSQGIAVRRLYDPDPRKHRMNIHGTHVDHPDDMPAADGTPVVIAVGAAGTREVIRPELEKRGHVIGGDAWFVA